MGYDGNGRLTSVTDNLGVSGRSGLTLTYTGSGPHIQSIADWSGRSWSFGYDGSGNLTSITNPLNDTVTYTYHAGTHLLNERILPVNRGGQQARTTFTYYRNNKAFTNANALGEGETVDYDLYRQRTRVTDPRGFIREHFYDKANGALTQLQEPDGAILRFANNADGLRYTKTDGLGFESQYSFMADRSISASTSNNFGRVSREIDPLNQTTDIDYGLFDQPTSTMDKRGNPVTRVYYQATNAGTDAVRGRLAEVRATVNGQLNVLLESYTYYASGAAFGQLKQKIETIDPAAPSRRRITDYVYEANGINLQSVTVSGATAGGSITRTFTYDALGRVTTETLSRRTSATDATPLNLTTTFEYDALGRVTKVTDPRGDIRETVYDANGQVSQEKVHYKQADGTFVIRTVATHAYDAADRRISTTDILGNTSTFAYDAADNLITQTDANGHVSRFEYDSMGRRSAVIDANGHRSEFTYDLGGRLIETKDANGNVTRFEYDALGRQTKIISPLGFETQTQYDANGNVTHETDANAMAGLQPKNNQNASLYRQYDELGRVILERDALNGDTVFTYDLLGNITAITDAEGQVTTFVYDDLGRLIETKDPVVEAGTDKTDKVLLYDEAGNVLLTEDRSGRQRRSRYDVLNRLILTEYLSDGTQDSLAYDAFGDLVQVSNADVAYTYSYTPRHELASKTDSRLNKTLSWTYDPVGNLVTKTDYQNELTEFQYDSTDQLVAMRNAGYLQASYHYDGAGRLLNRILSNGAQTDYRYDADNRLIGLKNQSADKTLVEDLSYQRDRVGNITQIADAVSGKTTTYTYDALYRLTGVDSSTNSEDRAYSYDAVGNRKTETANGATTYYCYHATDCSQGPKGNRLINIRTGSLTGALYRRFVYDDSGRLTEKQDGAGTPLYTVTYNGKGRVSQVNGNTFAYDPNDYRIEKDSQLYHLEGEHLEATYSATGQLQEKYLRGVVVDEIVNGYTYHSSNPNDWTNYTFHHDHLNSITGQTGHTGTVDETVSYGPFGSPNLTLPGTGNDLLFTGREYDRSTGLYYYRARYYDPEIGRFVSEDPLGFAAGDVNFYSYVGNNPINENDPSGKICGSGACVAAAIGIGRVVGPPIARFFASNTVRTSVASGSIAGTAGAVGTLVTSEGDFGAAGQTFLTNFAGGALLGPAIGSRTNLLFGSGATSTLTSNLVTTGVVDSANQLISNGEIDPARSAVALGTTTFGSFLLTNAFTTAGSTALSDIAAVEGIQTTLGIAGEFAVRDVQQSVNVGNNISSGNASGGFVLYPSKPNTNQLRQIYRK